MNRTIRLVLIALVLACSAVGAVARAQVENSTGTNVQEGDNRSTSRQEGRSSSGDAVGGQVTGVVSSGNTSVDARNVSEDSDITSGNATGENVINAFTGENVTNGTTNIGPGAADISNVNATNVQDGSNRSTFTQTASYTTGDGVGGQVIGAVTAAGGTTRIVGWNRSTNVSIQTGDADGANAIAAFTGLDFSDTLAVSAADIDGSCNEICANVQDGSNRTSVRQSSTAASGDGVAGQVIGAVSSGRTSIDATNRSDGVDVVTGNADSNNEASLFTGLNSGSATAVGPGAADVESSCDFCENVQDGSNQTTVDQSSTATTGDAVGGEVIGAVTSAGGSASIVASNTSTDSDVTTGDADSLNALASFTGLNSVATTTVIAADVDGTCLFVLCGNVQDGGNRLRAAQTARANTGDGVGGQVLGVVSAGAASLDAINRSDRVSVASGNANASNSASEVVGLNLAGEGPTNVGGGIASDVDGVNASNVQDGDNRRTLNQAADATSGDAVGGQVAGVVTSAGGTASAVLSNTSTDIESTSGEATFDNTDDGFVGLDTTGTLAD